MERTEHNPDLGSNGGRKTPRSGHKVRQTAFFLGELGKVSQSIRVWRMLVAEAWPRTPRKEGLLGGSSDDWGCPLGAQQCSGFLGACSLPGATQRTAHQEAFPASLGTSQASDFRDAPLEKHFQQAELSRNIQLLRGSLKL